MKATLAVSMLALTCAIQMRAGVVLTDGNGNNVVSHAQLWSVKDLNNTPPSGLSETSVSGAFSAAGSLSGGFDVVWTAARNWNFTDATTADSFVAYVANLDVIRIKTFKSSLGVCGDDEYTSKISAYGEVLFATVTNSVTGGTLVFNNIHAGQKTGSDVSYLFYDASQDRLTVLKQSGPAPESYSTGAFALETGDIIVIAAYEKNQGFRFGGLTVDVVSESGKNAAGAKKGVSSKKKRDKESQPDENKPETPTPIGLIY